jgi:hypothetical protein
MIKLLTNKYVIGAAGLLLALAAVWGYGAHKYKQGASQERAKLERQQIDIALGQQVEKDRADAIYRGQILASQATAKKWAAELDSTGRMLQSLRKQLQTAGTCSGLNDAGEDWIGILGRSWAEYQGMANEAGRLADKVTGLQGYVRAIRK